MAEVVDRAGVRHAACRTGAERRLPCRRQTKKGREGRNRTDIHEDYELRYRTKELRVSPDELKPAVQKVGPSTAAVREHLGR
jgi:hypothetical protein